jgi:hypothetical protein
MDVESLFVVRPVTGGPELSTKDVDPQWLQEHSGESPDPERPLSKLEYLHLRVSVPAGRRSAEVSVPTVKDQVRERAEAVRFQLADDTEEPRDGGPVLTGTVLDAS